MAADERVKLPEVIVTDFEGNSVEVLQAASERRQTAIVSDGKILMVVGTNCRRVLEAPELDESGPDTVHHFDSQKRVWLR